MSEPSTSAGSRKLRLHPLIVRSIGISAVLCAVGIFIIAVHHMRETAKRIECINNLRQMGMAILNYHDTNDSFPSEWGDHSSWYVSVLPFVEHVKTLGPLPIKVYLCPTRRTPITAFAKRDYGYAASQPPFAFSILDMAPQAEPALSVIARANGAEHTLLLAHVWMAPETYAGGDPTDLGWLTKNNARSVNDTAKLDGDVTGTIHHIGSSHRRALPCLFADGRVREIPYEFAHLAQAWSWNNAQAFPLP